MTGSYIIHALYIVGERRTDCCFSFFDSCGRVRDGIITQSFQAEDPSADKWMLDSFIKTKLYF